MGQPVRVESRGYVPYIAVYAAPLCAVSERISALLQRILPAYPGYPYPAILPLAAADPGQESLFWLP